MRPFTCQNFKYSGTRNLVYEIIIQIALVNQIRAHIKGFNNFVWKFALLSKQNYCVFS
jgi:hypothetical protein